MPTRKTTKRKTAKRAVKRSTTKRSATKKKVVTIPKGKRKGDTFTSAGKKYTVVSYTSSTGKRVRYAKKK